jgi:hypothetical protein
MEHKVIWIHGTFDCPSATDGTGQMGRSHNRFALLKDTEAENNKNNLKKNPDSGRVEALKELVNDPAAEVWGFEWSGIADETARKMGGANLVKHLRTVGFHEPNYKVSVATHSHGGNVLGHAMSSSDLNIAACYLFACPFFGSGVGNWRGSPNARKQVKTKYSFMHPTDRIQVIGAGLVGGGVTFSTCPDFVNYSISPTGGGGYGIGDVSHTSMSRSDAFRLARDEILKAK